jgi:hypothetical protein
VTTTDTPANQKWYMAGTEGTGEYLVIGQNKLGRLGIRPLGNDQVRIRIEPASTEAAETLAKCFPAENGWKQPGDGGQSRFSYVAAGDKAVRSIELALKLLATTGRLKRNFRALLWRKRISIRWQSS